MADAYKILYQGQLPAAVATLYTVPVSTKVIVKFVALQEATGAGGPYTVDLYINGTTAAKHWKGLSLSAGWSADWDGTLALNAGDTIAGVCSAATTVTITISGDEVT